MKCHLKTKFLTFELEGNSQLDLFREIAKAQEIFSEDTCGKCDGHNLRFVLREVDGNEYPELWCNSCGAKLAFGQSKKKPGNLFPKRKLTPDGKPDSKKGVYDSKGRGWTKWRGKPSEEESDAA